MPEATSVDGRRIFWMAEGEGRPVLLIHGFASDHRRNWIEPGWVRLLAGAGFRAIAYDQRGHGRSAKSYHPEDYREDRLPEDAVAVLDAAGAGSAVAMGYSMGASVALWLALRHPERVEALVLGGIGTKFPMLGAPLPDLEIVARGFEAPAGASIPVAARVYRTFAEKGGADLRALAACWRRPRPVVDSEALAAIDVPALVAVGDRDRIAGDAVPFAAKLTRGEFVLLPGKDHMKAVGSKEHQQAVLGFLASLGE